MISLKTRFTKTNRDVPIKYGFLERLAKKRLFKAFKSTLILYGEESSLHGIRYIFNDIQNIRSSKNRILRYSSIILWSLSFLICTTMALILMYLVWYRYQSTPTITTIDNNNYPIWNVPFPGITVCNVNKVYAPAAVKFTRVLMGEGISEEEAMEYLSNLAKLILPTRIDSLYLKIFYTLKNIGYTTERLMYELMQPCENLITQCAWLGKAVDCDRIFRISKSSQGFCCSFNYKPNGKDHEIYADKKIKRSSRRTQLPIYRVSGYGENVGLKLFLDTEIETYTTHTKPFYGAEILVHDAEDFPHSSDIVAVAQPGFHVHVNVIPTVVVSDPDIRDIPAKRRDIFANKYRQCSLIDIDCLRSNGHIFSSLQPDNYETFNQSNVGMNCDCLPSCTDEFYSYNTIISKFFGNDESLGNTTRNNADEQIIINHITLLVNFKDISCIKYRKSRFTTWDGLLSSFGGIFGLCLGGSILSVVEILYFCIFKLFDKYNQSEFKSHLFKGGDYPMNQPMFHINPNNQYNINATEYQQLFRINRARNNQYQRKRLEKDLKTLSTNYLNQIDKGPWHKFVTKLFGYRKGN